MSLTPRSANSGSLFRGRLPGGLYHDPEIVLGSCDVSMLRNFEVRRLLMSASCSSVLDWHPNADEFGFCASGNALVTVADLDGRKENFLVGEGDLFFFPKAAVTNVVNLGGDLVELIIASNEAAPNLLRSPGEAELSGQGLNRRRNKPVVRRVRIGGLEDIGLNRSWPTLQLAEAFPLMSELAIYSVRLTSGGKVARLLDGETNELAYVVSGAGRMTVSDTSGVVDIFDVKAGDVFGVAAGHMHAIEAAGPDDLHILAVFDQSELRAGEVRVISSNQVGDATCIDFSTRRTHGHTNQPTQISSTASH